MKLIALLSLAFSLLSATVELPENFQANFIQKITNTKQKVITYSGEVRFSNETLFKWSYKEPTQKEVCTDGKELLVVDHDLEQVSAYRIAKGIDIRDEATQDHHKVPERDVPVVLDLGELTKRYSIAIHL